MKLAGTPNRSSWDQHESDWSWPPRGPTRKTTTFCRLTGFINRYKLISVMFFMWPSLGKMLNSSGSTKLVKLDNRPVWGLCRGVLIGLLGMRPAKWRLTKCPRGHLESLLALRNLRIVNELTGLNVFLKTYLQSLLSCDRLSKFLQVKLHSNFLLVWDENTFKPLQLF